MLTLEQRVKRLERLLKTNESDSNTISLFREVHNRDASAGKRTLIKTFTIDNITPQGVIEAIRKDAKKVDYKNITDYISQEMFDILYEDACDKIGRDHDDPGVGYYEVELEGDSYDCILCVGDTISNNDDNYVALLMSATMYVRVEGSYDEGDLYEYGGRYGEGWYIDDDDTECGLTAIEMVDDDDLLETDGPAADKIHEVVSDIYKLKLYNKIV